MNPIPFSAETAKTGTKLLLTIAFFKPSVKSVSSKVSFSKNFSINSSDDSATFSINSFLILSAFSFTSAGMSSSSTFFDPASPNFKAFIFIISITVSELVPSLSGKLIIVASGLSLSLHILTVSSNLECSLSILFTIIAEGRFCFFTKLHVASVPTSTPSAPFTIANTVSATCRLALT
ncbi:hypothetical protein BMS3Abin04_03068 [bacterium BMS3Abin04]|nr:hypothetical protein BMS3Abin04_03068 [bacterium BMS3Abin04]